MAGGSPAADRTLTSPLVGYSARRSLDWPVTRPAGSSVSRVASLADRVAVLSVNVGVAGRSGEEGWKSRRGLHELRERKGRLAGVEPEETPVEEHRRGAEDGRTHHTDSRRPL